MKRSILLKISGRVQGVHFRAHTKKLADQLGLSGYAKNRDDGTVEIFAQGEEKKILQLVHSLEQGSLLSKVEGIEWKFGEVINHLQDFSILRTGNLLTDQVQAFSNLGKQLLLPEGTTVPKHVVIIPDGNRRWARERGLPTFEGHRKGFSQAKNLLETAKQLGIKTLTLWAFSTENWDRSEEEKKFLFEAYRGLIKDSRADALKNKVCVRRLGRDDRFPRDILQNLNALVAETRDFSNYFLNIALDYGGRDEIARTVRKLIEAKTKAEEVSENVLASFLDTAGVSDPDFIIRTSGEQRLSGILPWQGVYAELYFAKVHFPDFDQKEFQKAIEEYSHRQRRFGR